MYLEKIELENVGPFDLLEYKFPFDENDVPKPLILVGKNGSGKSIFLSYLVNVLLSFKQHLYKNTEVEEGRVYKLRSPDYIQSGKSFSFSKVKISKDIECCEWVLNATRRNFENNFKFSSLRKDWNKIGQDDNTCFDHNFNSKKEEVKNLINNGCLQYFPSNRFEDPAWLNHENLITKLEYPVRKRMQGFSNRTFISSSPLKTNQNWLYDLILDRELYDKRNVTLPIATGPNNEPQPINVSIASGGPSTILYEETLKLLRVILNLGVEGRFGIGPRTNRQLAVLEGETQKIPNIFQLSSGQTCLLNLFLSILRDFDLSDAGVKLLQEINGIVLVDEIDLHLHTQHQYEVLPKLIAMFPKVQFIITTHSPLFLIGLEKMLGTNGIEILELPHGKIIKAEQFSEFEDAYEKFSKSEMSYNQIQKEIQNSKSPVICLEGDTDKKYIEKAADFLNKKDLLDKIILIPKVGSGELDNIWKTHHRRIHGLVDKIVILLYDCEVKKEDDQKGYFYRRVIPLKDTHPIKKGIENLFSTETINKAKSHKPAFIDIEPTRTVTKRGQNIDIPQIETVNEDEKTNLCSWLCENGNQDDFQEFIKIFEIIEAII